MHPRVMAAHAVPVLDRPLAPVASAAARLPYRSVAVDTLRLADAEHWRVAVVGGHPAQREAFHRRFVAAWPGLSLIGHWTPMPRAASSTEVAADIARQIRHTDADLVIVCLAEPARREWIDVYGDASGARALLAVDAIDELHTLRAASGHREGARSQLDPVWRLMLEPKRWAKRFLVEGPPAFPAVRRSSARPDA